MAYYGFDDSKFTVEYWNPKPKLPNGEPYDRIDLHSTLTNPQNRGIESAWTGFQKFISDYVLGYDEIEGAPRKHATAIVALQELSMKLQFPLGTC